MAAAVASVRIHLTKKAKDAFDHLVEQTGMTQQELAQRLFQWLLDQPTIVRAYVLGQIDEETAMRLLQAEASNRELAAAGEQLAGDAGKILTHEVSRKGRRRGNQAG